jgi:hypothetical protein
MKTIVLLFLLALVACDKPPSEILTGCWEGTMYVQKVPVYIRFDLCQFGEEISGMFYSGFGSGLVELSQDSRIISGRMVIVVDDPTYSVKYIFSGTLHNDCCVSGEYTLTLYNNPYVDWWEAYKN